MRSRCASSRNVTPGARRPACLITRCLVPRITGGIRGTRTPRWSFVSRTLSCVVTGRTNAFACTIASAAWTSSASQRKPARRSASVANLSGSPPGTRETKEGGAGGDGGGDGGGGVVEEGPADRGDGDADIAVARNRGGAGARGRGRGTHGAAVGGPESGNDRDAIATRPPCGAPRGGGRGGEGVKGFSRGKCQNVVARFRPPRTFRLRRRAASTRRPSTSFAAKTLDPRTRRRPHSRPRARIRAVCAHASRRSVPRGVPDGPFRGARGAAVDARRARCASRVPQARARRASRSRRKRGALRPPHPRARRRARGARVGDASPAGRRERGRAAVRLARGPSRVRGARREHVEDARREECEPSRYRARGVAVLLFFFFFFFSRPRRKRRARIPLAPLPRVHRDPKPTSDGGIPRLARVAAAASRRLRRRRGRRRNGRRPRRGARGRGHRLERGRRREAGRVPVREEGN